MEETTGAPSSFAALSPRRLRASSRDGGGVVNRPPSPLTMLLSRHTRRREVYCGARAAAARALSLARRSQPRARNRLSQQPVGRRQPSACWRPSRGAEGSGVSSRDEILASNFAGRRATTSVCRLAAELSQLDTKCDVIITGGGAFAALAAKRRRDNIPIVFTVEATRSRSGLSQASLDRAAT